MYRPIQTYHCYLVNYPNGRLDYSEPCQVEAINLNQAYQQYKSIIRSRGFEGVQRIYIVNVEKVWDHQLKIIKI